MTTLSHEKLDDICKRLNIDEIKEIVNEHNINKCLIFCVRYGSSKCVHYLLEQGALLTTMIDRNTAIEECIRTNRIQMMKMFLSSYPDQLKNYAYKTTPSFEMKIMLSEWNASLYMDCESFEDYTDYISYLEDLVDYLVKKL